MVRHLDACICVMRAADLATVDACHSSLTGHQHAKTVFQPRGPQKRFHPNSAVLNGEGYLVQKAIFLLLQHGVSAIPVGFASVVSALNIGFATVVAAIERSVRPDVWQHALLCESLGVQCRCMQAGSVPACNLLAHARGEQGLMSCVALSQSASTLAASNLDVSGCPCLPTLYLLHA